MKKKIKKLITLFLFSILVIGIFLHFNSINKTEDLFLDPSEYNFKNDTMNYAQATMEELFPECDIIKCEGKNTYIYDGKTIVEDLNLQITHGHDSKNNKFALVECTGREVGTNTGSGYFTIFIDIEDGHIIPIPDVEYPKYPFCRNADGIKSWHIQSIDGKLTTYEKI